jgi:pimeloyl-ACP methyl ester carboxylesterase
VIVLLAPLLLGGATVTATAVAADGAPKGTPSAEPPGPVAWAPCADRPDTDCGAVTVPIDWSKPDGETIQIALARRKATDPSARIGSLLIDPGGPGGSGVGIVKANALPFSPELLSRFDLVGFDPRGVGQSHPVMCDSDLVAEIPDDMPKDQAQFDQLVRVNRRFADSCRNLTGKLFDFVDTKSVARDMEAIRAGIGDDKLTYYGASYGTLMGEEYAELFPDKIRAMALDGVLDHSIDSTWQFMRIASTASEESFDEFVKWCTGDTACVLHGHDVHALFAELQARAAKGDLADPSTGEHLVPMSLRWNVNQLLYAPAWRQLATMLDGLAKSTAIAKASTSTEEGTAAGTPVASVHQSVICQDWKLPVKDFAELDAYRAGLDQVAPDMKTSPQAWSLVRPCIGWMGSVRDPQHPYHWKTTAPVLMLNSRFDPATSYEFAAGAARETGATLLTYDGWGHGAYWEGSSCVTRATDTYLLTTAVPAAGTHCPAVPPQR